jgi:hypothetical protein
LRSARGVLCRIETRRENGKPFVHVAGRLSEAHVPDLLTACATDEPSVLELDELISVDAVGLDALMRLEQGGVELRALPQYLRLKLEVLEREGNR